MHELNQAAGTSLLDVYPNPFVERTTLRFTSGGGRVLIQLFDEQGQLMRTLHHRETPAGTHTLDVDLGPLPVGVYYCRLQEGARQQLKHLLKVR